MRWLTSAAILGLLPGVASAQNLPAVGEAAASITPEDIRQRIGVLAHDSMRGRNTPSPEIEKTAQYVASEFARFGLEPGGNDAYLQRYAMAWTQMDVAAAGVEIRGGPTWRFGRDVLQRAGGTDSAGVTGHVVLVSGVPTAEAPVPEGLDFGGMIAVILLPLTPDGRFAPGAGPLFQAIATAEPAGIIIVTGPADLAWRQRVSRPPPRRLVPSWSQEQEPIVVEVRDSAIAEVLASRGVVLEDVRRAPAAGVRVQHLTDLVVTIRMPSVVLESVTAPNTVGILEGSDPGLREEYIVFSAHMDHVGVGTPVEGDSIYNGADDDASGTAAVIELAEAFARLTPRPKRSMIFLTVSGEEKGLWGSDYFTTHPPVPIGQIVADLNADMIGRNWRDTVVVIGREHSDLGETLARVNAAHPELQMTAIDDLWPEENFYYRSDHYNFARRGVPVLFFFSGTHADYHRPSDHVEKIDAEKESRIVRLIFYLGLELANAADRPRWNPDSYRQIVEGTGH